MLGALRRGRDEEAPTPERPRKDESETSATVTTPAGGIFTIPMGTTNVSNTEMIWSPQIAQTEPITSASVLAEQVRSYLDSTRMTADELVAALRNYEEYLVTELNAIQDLQNELVGTANGGSAQTPTPTPRKRKGGVKRTRPRAWANGLSRKSFEATMQGLLHLGEATNEELIKFTGVYQTSVRAATKYARDVGMIEVVSGKGTAKSPYVYALTKQGKENRMQVS